jgi:hypothetical protein
LPAVNVLVSELFFESVPEVVLLLLPASVIVPVSALFKLLVVVSVLLYVVVPEAVFLFATWSLI